MKISAILSFFCLFAVAIVPSASAAAAALEDKPVNARRSASIVANNKKSRTHNVRALREHVKKAAAAKKAAPEDGGVATTPSHHNGRALFLDGIFDLIFGGGEEEEGEGDLDILGLVGILFEILVPVLLGGGEATDTLVLEMLKAILEFLFEGDELIGGLLDLIFGILDGDVELTDENRVIIADGVSGLVR